MIHITIPGMSGVHRCPVKVDVFKSGEVNVRLMSVVARNLGTRKLAIDTDVVVTAHLTNSDLVMAFFLTCDALRRIEPDVRIHAVIPYLPYARQDHVCNPGEALSLSLFAKLLNAMKLTSVELHDPHSDSAAALIERSRVIDPEMHVREIIEHRILSLSTNNLRLVAPSTSALKKVKKISDHLKEQKKVGSYVVAVKVHDPYSLDPNKIILNEEVFNKDLLVVADICDDDEALIQLGKVLRDRGCNELNLFVTHGIFSRGLDELLEVYGRIYTTDSFHPDDTDPIRVATQEEPYLDSNGLRRVHWFGNL